MIVNRTKGQNERRKKNPSSDTYRYTYRYLSVYGWHPVRMHPYMIGHKYGYIYGRT